MSEEKEKIQKTEDKGELKVGRQYVLLKNFMCCPEFIQNGC